ncbi:MAG: GAF domain-containing sensor histidine kinase [Desulfobacterales bacterium]
MSGQEKALKPEPLLDPSGHRDAEEMIARYRMICELGQMVTSEVNLEALFGLIIRQTTRIMACEKASVFLYDPLHHQLWSWVSTDLKRNSIRISTSCGVAGWVFCSKTALILNEPYQDPRFYSGVDSRTGFRTRNILCIPLINRQQASIGTLQALNKRSGNFTEQDRELLTAASYYMTIALENAKIYEDLKMLDRARERVIHHLSHEIRTPLSIIGSVLSRLKKGLQSGQAVDLEKTVLRGERNLERLRSVQEKIDDILRCKESPGAGAPDVDVHQLAVDLLTEVLDEAEEASPALVRQLIDRLAAVNRRREIILEIVGLEALLQAVCDKAEASMQGRELCIMRQLDGQAEIFTDRRILESVCAGLLKNAIENTPDEGVIEVCTETRGDETRIAFTDHGVGITPENQALIFSGFFHTQPTERYSSKKPYEFNAGGAGADLLRINSFASRLGFRVAFKSRRCPFLLNDEEICPGRISSCRFIRTAGECLSGSGSTFAVVFPAASIKTA